MISNEVLSHPIFLRVSRDSGPPHCSVLYETDWNPPAFFREQKYHDGDYKYSEAEAFSRALTLTGVLDEAEALSCREYICRTWPQSGKAFIHLMEMHLASEDERESRVTLQDGTELLVYPDRSRVSFKAAGQPDTVIELGEQLAWVSCAMRSSNIPKCASFRPFIEQTLKTGQTEDSLDLVMQLRCREQPLTEPPREDASGECWLQLFRNPVIVEGFPISRRAQLHIGLEMDLATMGLLARGRRISTFNSYLLIKGYRTMLVAVKAVSNVVLWHVLTKEGEGDIEYYDPRVQQLKPQTDSMVPWSQLKNMKHVVGWCSHVKNNAGMFGSLLQFVRYGLFYCTYRIISLSSSQFWDQSSNLLVSSSPFSHFCPAPLSLFLSNLSSGFILLLHSFIHSLAFVPLPTFLQLTSLDSSSYFLLLNPILLRQVFARQ
ncbi:hypothetical protein N8I77_002648 [Diaporthe amygdali]|uniref:Uncharacterized protein n=1 Tax=Phomopsis amygdali TaxID=1214568 RepID=A0AAD9STT3_PHOAM|nr:hypothetical protein N8I77_002648 [Diaporthe amygdali]